MDRWETGMLAKSLAGHDKDKVYVIVGLDEQFTYLADGERKTLQSPKKKKKKHVQLIREQHEISEADDVKLKRILKEYKMSEKKEDKKEKKDKEMKKDKKEKMEKPVKRNPKTKKVVKM